jgi:hypothetical protein
MRLERHHLLFAVAFLIWGACVAMALGIAGSAWAVCADRGYGHSSIGCRRDVELLIWGFALAALIGGALLLKRLAARLGIDLG